jgi:hypothetical protein
LASSINNGGDFNNRQAENVVSYAHRLIKSQHTDEVPINQELIDAVKVRMAKIASGEDA